MAKHMHTLTFCNIIYVFICDMAKHMHTLTFCNISVYLRYGQTHAYLDVLLYNICIICDMTKHMHTLTVCNISVYLRYGQTHTLTFCNDLSAIWPNAYCDVCFLRIKWSLLIPLFVVYNNNY